MTSIFTPAITPPAIFNESYWFIYRGYRILTVGEGANRRLPFMAAPADIGVNVVRQLYLGQLDDKQCFAAEVMPETSSPAGMSFRSVRQLFGELADDLFNVVMRSVQLVDWERHNQFCGQCAAPMANQAHERAKKCPKCGLVRYPRISPAVIMAIIKDSNQILLARSTNHPAGFYSVLAGFVEPGESLEEAVARETREEVGIEVTDIQYFGSQPWPFPDSLMVAFTAKYAGGEIRLEEDEIAEAGWFRVDELPAGISPPISIARWLIDDFVRGAGG